MDVRKLNVSYNGLYTERDAGKPIVAGDDWLWNNSSPGRHAVRYD